jgi:hypothetical protein
MRPYSLGFLLSLIVVSPFANAIGPNDYNEDMVTIQHNFAACVGGYYKHDFHWATLPGTCCGWESVHHWLMQRSYPSGTQYNLYKSSTLGAIHAPQCILVPHNYWYKMRLNAYAQAYNQGILPWVYWVSHEEVAAPTKCITSQ